MPFKSERTTQAATQAEHEQGNFFCSFFRVLITVLCIKIFQRKKQSSIFFKTYLGCHFYEAYDRHGVAQNSLLVRTFWKVVPAVASPPTPGRTAYCASVVFHRYEVTQSARRVFTALVGLCSGVCSTSSSALDCNSRLLTWETGKCAILM